MSVTLILPIPGVPDELLRALNDRFRQIDSGSSGTVSGSRAGIFFLHALRPDANGTPAGTFGSETDRGVLFQVQTVFSSQVWVYVSGTMADAYANLPADLGVNDEGFQFLATDTYQFYRWSGTAWVELTQANDMQLAHASASLSLSNSFQDVASATLTLNRAGRYLITGTFDLLLAGAGDAGQTLIGQLVADGSAQAELAQVVSTATGTRWMASQQWSYTPAAAGKVVRLQAKRNAGTGSSTCNHPHTTISAIWIGP